MASVAPSGKLDVSTARFYAACVASALTYLHHLDIVHRDVKQENLLIDEHGYLKLIDFGFAKVLEDHVTFTFCGTPDYLAPEILEGTGHGKPVDWTLDRHLHFNWQKTEDFWARFSRPWLLLFEPDTVMCPRPRLPLETFSDYAFVGAPWAKNACLLKCSSGSTSTRPLCAHAIAVCEQLEQAGARIEPAAAASP